MPFDLVRAYNPAGGCEPTRHTAYELAQWAGYQALSLDTPQVRDRVWQGRRGDGDFVGAFYSEPADSILLSKAPGYYGVLPLEISPTYAKPAPWRDPFRGAP